MIAPADQPRRVMLSDAQRAKIFALASERGLTHDDLKRLAPRGSIRGLTPIEAHRLIDELQGKNQRRGPTEPTLPGRVNPHIPLPTSHAPSKRPPRLKPGQYRMLTPEQADDIERLSAEIMQLYAWTRAKFCQWLEARHYAGDKSRPMTNPQSTRDGMEVIRLLRAVCLQARTAKAKAAADATVQTTEQPAASAAHRRQRIAASSTP